jgi:uncharacterized protein YkvS
MRHFKEYKKVIATKEMSAGNESVGDMWIETATFDKNAKVGEIVEWAKGCGGRLIITIDEGSALSDNF